MTAIPWTIDEMSDRSKELADTLMGALNAEHSLSYVDLDDIVHALGRVMASVIIQDAKHANETCGCGKDHTGDCATRAKMILAMHV